MSIAKHPTWLHDHDIPCDHAYQFSTAWPSSQRYKYIFMNRNTSILDSKNRMYIIYVISSVYVYIYIYRCVVVYTVYIYIYA